MNTTFAADDIVIVNDLADPSFGRTGTVVRVVTLRSETAYLVDLGDGWHPAYFAEDLTHIDAECDRCPVVTDDLNDGDWHHDGACETECGTTLCPQCHDLL